mgnify:CR=1 FL=1
MRIFQSTLPLRGATNVPGPRQHLAPISIHAPLAGSDNIQTRGLPRTLYFNPRSPCGERRGLPRTLLKLPGFQSTLPLRGATKMEQTIGLSQMISIHAPLAGSDRIMLWLRLAHDYFNPRSPCGERLETRQNQGI